MSDNFRDQSFIMRGPVGRATMDPGERVQVEEIRVSEYDVRYALNTVMKAAHDFYKVCGCKAEYILTNRKTYAAVKAHMMQNIHMRLDGNFDGREFVFEGYKIICDPALEEDARALTFGERQFLMPEIPRSNRLSDQLLSLTKMNEVQSQALSDAEDKVMECESLNAELEERLFNADIALTELHGRVNSLKRAIWPLGTMIVICVLITIFSLLTH